MKKNYNIYTLIAKSTDHLFRDDGGYSRKVNKPYVKALIHVYWRMLSLYHLLDRHNCPRIAQVVDNFGDLLLNVETYYDNQMYPDMRRTLLEIEEYIFNDKLKKCVTDAYHYEVAQGSNIPFDLDTAKILFSTLYPTSAFLDDYEGDDLYTVYNKEYSSLDSDQQRALSDDDVCKAINAAFYTTFDLEEDK